MTDEEILFMKARHVDRIETMGRERGATLDQLEATEAKLAKAVEALRSYSAAFNSSGNITERHLCICEVALKADALLAEIGGEE